MKAALLVRPGEIVIDEVPEPVLGPDDVLIAVGGVGLCGSDLSVFSGKWASPASPWIMGHEAFGTIEAVGENVPPGRVGETVVVEPNVACLTCEQCGRGRTSACVRRQSVGMSRQGALAERLVVPSPYAWAMPGIAPETLVCVEPTAVVLTALRRLEAPLPASVLVVGVGAQGLLMTLALVGRGVEVHARDLNPDRIALAKRLGAHVAAEETQPFDLVIDTVGSPASVEWGFDRLEVAGTMLFLGLDGRPLEITSQSIVRRQAVLRGSLTYDHPGDFESTVDRIASGSFAPGAVVTDRYPLDRVQEAFERSPRAAGKTWIRVGD